MTLGPTPSQTAGPFLHIGLEWDDGAEVVAADAAGALWLRGRLLDGDGNPVDDGLIETWQADAEGRYPRPDAPTERTPPGFRRLGRCATDDDGAWAVRTVKPGRVPGSDGTLQAPHVAITLLARGLLRHVVTRAYFADEEAANSEDPLLSSLSSAQRATLLAERTDDGYRLDLRLRGEDATVFLDF